MPTWTTTTWMYQVFGTTIATQSDGKKWGDGITHQKEWAPDYDKLTRCLNEVTSWCSDNQYTIKGLMPLTSAHALTFGTSYVDKWTDRISQSGSNWVGDGINGGLGWGLGYGYGVSNIIGFAALVEKTEEISEAEYAFRADAPKRRKAASGLKDELQRLNQSLTDARNRAESVKAGLASANLYRDTAIETRKGMFGTKFVVRDKEFKKEHEAAAFIAEQDAIRQSSDGKIAAAEDSVRQIEAQISALDGQLRSLQV